MSKIDDKRRTMDATPPFLIYITSRPSKLRLPLTDKQKLQQMRHEKYKFAEYARLFGRCVQNREYCWKMGNKKKPSLFIRLLTTHPLNSFNILAMVLGYTQIMTDIYLLFSCEQICNVSATNTPVIVKIA